MNRRRHRHRCRYAWAPRPHRRFDQERIAGVPAGALHDFGGRVELLDISVGSRRVIRARGVASRANSCPRSMRRACSNGSRVRWNRRRRAVASRSWSHAAHVAVEVGETGGLLFAVDALLHPLQVEHPRRRNASTPSPRRTGTPSSPCDGCDRRARTRTWAPPQRGREQRRLSARSNLRGSNAPGLRGRWSRARRRARSAASARRAVNAKRAGFAGCVTCGSRPWSSVVYFVRRLPAVGVNEVRTPRSPRPGTRAPRSEGAADYAGCGAG